MPHTVRSTDGPGELAKNRNSCGGQVQEAQRLPPPHTHTHSKQLWKSQMLSVLCRSVSLGEERGAGMCWNVTVSCDIFVKTTALLSSAASKQRLSPKDRKWPSAYLALEIIFLKGQAIVSPKKGPLGTISSVGSKSQSGPPYSGIHESLEFRNKGF